MVELRKGLFRRPVEHVVRGDVDQLRVRPLGRDGQIPGAQGVDPVGVLHVPFTYRQIRQPRAVDNHVGSVPVGIGAHPLQIGNVHVPVCGKELMGPALLQHFTDGRAQLPLRPRYPNLCLTHAAFPPRPAVRTR